MIGGDLYAYTIIGIDFCEELDDVRFLILDPHYPGSDNNIKNILQKGWCAWKEVTMFKADAFYNLCMPLRPRDFWKRSEPKILDVLRKWMCVLNYLDSN